MSEELQHGHAAAADEDDPRGSATFLVGLIGAIVVLVVVLGLETLYYRTVERENERKVLAEQPEQLRHLQAEQLRMLNEYRWVDQPNQVVAIPIERAMQLVAEERKAGNE